MSTRADGLRQPLLVMVGTATEPVAGGVSAAVRAHAHAARRAGLDVEVLASHRSGSAVGKVVPWLRTSRALRALVVRGVSPPAIVVAHAGAWPSLVRKAALLRRARALGAHTVMVLHAVEVDRYLRRPPQRRLLFTALGAADVVGVLTPWWRRRLRGAGHTGPLALIPNPLPPEIEAEAGTRRAASRAPDAPLRLLVFTRLVRGKGVSLAIDAVADSADTDVTLRVAGDGPRRSALERLVRERGVADRIHFVGWLEGEARREAMSSSDALCHVSHHDALPMGVLEAMARGLPVLTSREGSLPDVVPDGVAGLLVGDRGELADAIEALRDPSLRAELGEGARQTVLQRHGARVVGEAWADLTLHWPVDVHRCRP